ncbi:MAG: YihY/virulence factor BrkB family protein [Armatimonadetes bacterium]|nr:YihY/virulence factor BrkB family protein [Armatimonadota bacterium]
MRAQAVRNLVASLLHKLAQDDVFILASAIAYTALLSLFPLLVGIIALLSRVVTQAEAQRVVIEALNPYLPPDALRLVQETLAAVFATRDAAGILAVVALFWSGTAVAGALRHALNRVLRVGAIRPLGRVAAIILAPPWGAVVAAAGPLIFPAAALLIVYGFLPNIRMHWRSLLVGTASGWVLVQLATRGFLWYVGTLAAYPLVYGPLAGIVVFLIWVYLVALAVLVGAEVGYIAAGPLGRSHA